jgi:hypothetical protein
MGKLKSLLDRSGNRTRNLWFASTFNAQPTDLEAQVGLSRLYFGTKPSSFNNSIYLLWSPIGFPHFRPPKIYARKITTLENPPKAQHFFNTYSPPARQSVYAKNSFVLRQVSMLSARDLELMGIGIQSGNVINECDVQGRQEPTTGPGTKWRIGEHRPRLSLSTLPLAHWPRQSLFLITINERIASELLARNRRITDKNAMWTMFS